MNERVETLFLIDSNILIYGYDNTDKRKHEIAKKLLSKCWKKEVPYIISTQNLAEFFVIVTKKIPNPISIEKAECIINDIIAFSHWHVISYNQSTLQKAISLYKEEKKHFWDVLIIATMQQNSILHIYTENTKDFALYKNVFVVNPFD